MFKNFGNVWTIIGLARNVKRAAQLARRVDNASRNRHVPWNPDVKCENTAAVALQCREAGVLLWRYNRVDPEDEPHPPETLTLRHNVSLFARSVRWNEYWTRAMQKMLDSPHLRFVHCSTIGRVPSNDVAEGRRAMLLNGARESAPLAS